jgi:large subunit ribosomal protein L21
MYAIIEDSGAQIKVKEGDTIKVSLRELGTEQATLTFDKILVVGNEGGDAKLGQPYVAGAKVTADILGEFRDKKVHIVKFARRKNYKRSKGHRQDHLKVKITRIEA